jgi:hypothetical protein
MEYLGETWYGLKQERIRKMYKAKRLDNGKVVEGDAIKYRNHQWQIYNRKIKSFLGSFNAVDPTTLKQKIGDKWYTVEEAESQSRYCPKCEKDVPNEEVTKTWHTCGCKTVPRFSEERRKRLRAEEKVEGLVAAIDGFWEHLYNGYNIESREEIEKDCKESWSEGTSPLAVALHFIWKREPKVEGLVAFVEGVAEADCCYGDNCPESHRHGQCDPCKAREVLQKGEPQ